MIRLKHVIFVFSLLGPLIGVMIFTVLTWPEFSILVSIAGYLVGIFPAALTGIICGVLYEYFRVNMVEPNFYIITAVATVSGFIFSCFPFGDIEETALLGVIGATSALMCSLVCVRIYKNIDVKQV